MTFAAFRKVSSTPFSDQVQRALTTRTIFEGGINAKIKRSDTVDFLIKDLKFDCLTFETSGVYFYLTAYISEGFEINLGEKMRRTQLLPVNDLATDLQNFRIVTQKDEVEAIKAMISISPDYFWGSMESLLNDDYLPMENFIVLEDSTNGYQIKEGNRRVASLKIMLGLIDLTDLGLPGSSFEETVH